MFNKIQEMTDPDYLLKNKITITKLSNKLDGRIEGFKGSYNYCYNYDQLEHILTSLRPKVLKKAFENNLGIKLDSLSKRQKTFFEICIA